MSRTVLNVKPVLWILKFSCCSLEDGIYYVQNVLMIFVTETVAIIFHSEAASLFGHPLCTFLLKVCMCMCHICVLKVFIFYF